MHLQTPVVACLQVRSSARSDQRFGVMPQLTVTQTKKNSTGCDGNTTTGT